MTIADGLFDRKDALLSKIDGSSDPAFVNNLAQIATVFNAPLPAQMIDIIGAENSAAFTLPARLNFAHIGTTTIASRTLKLQYTSDNGSNWYDTGIEVTANTNNPTRLTADDLARLAPLCGRKDFFRLNLDMNDSITTIWYSSN
ncbi:hypothetical protein Pse7367_3679 (plasmid) [Thalassoporum mexicanum PCC 7367]|uniref:hypothetical protein n=1 Tax=Thalassoporum mexicanum TaxID=3457544 RepID=UPI00029F90CC|nr:hypothetical protein [Pseudanabaena sp. PCC 7367]AFY71912.1 hypothetical protein Pse7367_3679 [Pseudanabaena sp. PCC 7367]